MPNLIGRCRRPAVLVALAVTLSGCFFNLDVASLVGTSPLQERVVLGEDGPKIAMLEVEGVILDTATRNQLGGRSPSMAARLREALDLASEDDEVRAVLLRIQSPGGTVSASETIYYQLRRFAEKSEKPVIAYLQGLATSGGYYVAMAADRVVAHPTTVTGSIGVIMAGLNFSGLMERYGVADQSFTSGPYKDSGSPLRAMRDDEREHLQGVVQDLYGRFVEVVKQGRPSLDASTVAALADGRIYTATQALELGLVDELGHLEDVVDGIEARLSLRESRLIVYTPEGQYRNNLLARPSWPIEIDVNLLPLPHRLPTGFYYLWPAALRDAAIE